VDNSTIYTAITQDTTLPLLNNISLNTTSPNTGDLIIVTVNATDNTGVTVVEAGGISLIYRGGNVWNGTIIAIEGTHSVNVSARDSSGNVAWDNSTIYTAITQDTTLPLLNNISLNTTSPNTGDLIIVTVNATDNTGVTVVEAGGISLIYRGGNVWNGPSLRSKEPIQ